MLLKSDDLQKEGAGAWQRYELAFQGYQFHEALAAIWDFMGRIDGYLNDKEPWRLLRGRDHDFAETLTDELGHIFSSLVIALANIGWMLKPFLSETSDKIIDALGLDHDRKEPWEGRVVHLKRVAPLFPRKE
jgi:methionyl-tRNA synthetase